MAWAQAEENLSNLMQMHLATLGQLKVTSGYFMISSWQYRTVKELYTGAWVGTLGKTSFF